MRKFLRDHAGDWELRLPALLGAVRATPMVSLGGRSPMEVVMGIKPQLPATIQSRLPVEDIGATDYVRSLLDYLETTHREVFLSWRGNAQWNTKGRTLDGSLS